MPENRGGTFVLALKHVRILLSCIPLIPVSGVSYLPGTSIEGFRPFLSFFFLSCGLLMGLYQPIDGSTEYYDMR